MAQVHRYQTRLGWRGSTGAGYARYGRAHDVTAPPARSGLRLSADPAFRGDGELLNPEQLVLAAASSCQLLSFLAVAALAGVDVLAYDDDAEAEMPTHDRPVRITRIVLRPRVVLAAGTDPDLVLELLERAHQECYVASSLRTEVVLQPTVTTAGGTR
jgi:organic hydroperoxide reductase OsmC/OhrA